MLNDMLEWPIFGEAAVIGRGVNLPAGVSIAMVCG